MGKENNASRKCARHALCNMIQSLGYMLSVKVWRQQEKKHSTSKVINVHDSHYAIMSYSLLSHSNNATEQSMHQKSKSAFRNTICSTFSAMDEVFPGTLLTACNLHCSGATAAWRAMLIILHGVTGCVATARSLEIWYLVQGTPCSGDGVYTTVL